MYDPYSIVREFEDALCDYTGAKYAVTTTSCTMAILLACAWARTQMGPKVVNLPKRTYCSVPMSVIHAGHTVEFENREWLGAYYLHPVGVVDSARHFTGGMSVGFRDLFQCVSFHWSKHLALGQGGAILHDNTDADAWLRRARFDGRCEGVHPINDTFNVLGWHCYMSPETAAEGLMRLALLPEHNDDLPNDDYPDLSTWEIFK